jgi:hypothetical protein
MSSTTFFLETGFQTPLVMKFNISFLIDSIRFSLSRPVNASFVLGSPGSEANLKITLSMNVGLYDAFEFLNSIQIDAL